MLPEDAGSAQLLSNAAQRADRLLVDLLAQQADLLRSVDARPEGTVPAAWHEGGPILDRAVDAVRRVVRSLDRPSSSSESE